MSENLSQISTFSNMLLDDSTIKVMPSCENSCSDFLLNRKRKISSSSTDTAQSGGCPSPVLNIKSNDAPFTNKTTTSLFEKDIIKYSDKPPTKTINRSILSNGKQNAQKVPGSKNVTNQPQVPKPWDVLRMSQQAYLNLKLKLDKNSPQKNLFVQHLLAKTGISDSYIKYLNKPKKANDEIHTLFPIVRLDDENEVSQTTSMYNQESAFHKPKKYRNVKTFLLKPDKKPLPGLEIPLIKTRFMKKVAKNQYYLTRNNHERKKKIKRLLDLQMAKRRAMQRKHANSHLWQSRSSNGIDKWHFVEKGSQNSSYLSRLQQMPIYRSNILTNSENKFARNSNYSSFKHKYISPYVNYKQRKTVDLRSILKTSKIPYPQNEFSPQNYARSVILYTARNLLRGKLLCSHYDSKSNSKNTSLSRHKVELYGEFGKVLSTWSHTLPYSADLDCMFDIKPSTEMKLNGENHLSRYRHEDHEYKDKEWFYRKLGKFSTIHAKWTITPSNENPKNDENYEFPHPGFRPYKFSDLMDAKEALNDIINLICDDANGNQVQMGHLQPTCRPTHTDKLADENEVNNVQSVLQCVIDEVCKLDTDYSMPQTSNQEKIAKSIIDNIVDAVTTTEDICCEVERDLHTECEIKCLVNEMVQLTELSMKAYEPVPGKCSPEAILKEANKNGVGNLIDYYNGPEAITKNLKFSPLIDTNIPTFDDLLDAMNMENYLGDSSWHGVNVDVKLSDCKAKIAFDNQSLNSYTSPDSNSCNKNCLTPDAVSSFGDDDDDYKYCDYIADGGQNVNTDDQVEDEIRQLVESIAEQVCDSIQATVCSTNELKTTENMLCKSTHVDYINLSSDFQKSTDFILKLNPSQNGFIKTKDNYKIINANVSSVLETVSVSKEDNFNVAFPSNELKQNGDIIFMTMPETDNSASVALNKDGPMILVDTNEIGNDKSNVHEENILQECTDVVNFIINEIENIHVKNEEIRQDCLTVINTICDRIETDEAKQIKSCKLAKKAKTALDAFFRCGVDTNVHCTTAKIENEEIKKVSRQHLKRNNVNRYDENYVTEPNNNKKTKKCGKIKRHYSQEEFWKFYADYRKTMTAKFLVRTHIYVEAMIDRGLKSLKPSESPYKEDMMNQHGLINFMQSIVKKNENSSPLKGNGCVYCNKTFLNESIAERRKHLKRHKDILPVYFEIPTSINKKRKLKRKPSSTDLNNSKTFKHNQRKGNDETTTIVLVEESPKKDEASLPPPKTNVNLSNPPCKPITYDGIGKNVSLASKQIPNRAKMSMGHRKQTARKSVKNAALSKAEFIAAINNKKGLLNYSK